MRKMVCLLMIMVVSTLSFAGCTDEVLVGERELTNISLELLVGDESAIEISGLGLDSDSIVNLTMATFFIEVTFTDLVDTRISKTRYDVEIVDGQLVAKPDRLMSTSVQKDSRFSFDIKYGITSDDPEVKGLDLIGGPDGDNVVSGTFRPKKIKGFDMHDWLVIEDISDAEGEITKIERNERSNAGKNYVITMGPHDLKVVFDFMAFV